MNLSYCKIPLPGNFPFHAYEAALTCFNTDPAYYHWHKCIEISYVRSGTGFYYVNGRTHTMKEGDIILFNSMEPHAWHVSSPVPMLQPVIVFDPIFIWSFEYEYLKPFYGRCTNFANKLPEDHPATRKIYEILNVILEEYTMKPKSYELMIKVKLLEILTYLIRYFHDDDTELIPAVHKNQQLLKLSDIIGYVNKNYTDIIRIEEMAHLAGMNTTYFSTFFKKTMGATFTDYLIKLRVSRSLQLITTTDDTLASIAFSCGFNSISNFYRAFKKYHGGSPLDIRKNGL